ncbi:YceK/YidQ family lipoprotein [Pseudomonas tolaasii]|uniref:YceK/YidQ family lipoprotein n=1 Tax=Pseudomonas tolaasii TaxID=29442 RepID=UPI001C5835EC|nr:YceK/YidQ family lipoprotein [Pseudomonas tolaasii]MBW1250628.1 YceK/YidQ family lipoprotein [Pseudomonas tolaasii]
MKMLIALFLAASVTGCGTISTVFRDDSTVSQSLGNRRTYCDSIPRVYSGVAYDFCVLSAPDTAPGGSATEVVPALQLVLVDMVFSGVFDTVVLPYSAYQQCRYGNLAVSRGNTVFR